jgi:hypothetical protein
MRIRLILPFVVIVLGSISSQAAPLISAGLHSYIYAGAWEFSMSGAAYVKIGYDLGRPPFDQVSSIAIGSSYPILPDPYEYPYPGASFVDPNGSVTWGQKFRAQMTFRDDGVAVLDYYITPFSIVFQPEFEIPPTYIGTFYGSYLRYHIPDFHNMLPTRFGDIRRLEPG